MICGEGEGWWISLRLESLDQESGVKPCHPLRLLYTPGVSIGTENALSLASLSLPFPGMNIYSLKKRRHICSDFKQRFLIGTFFQWRQQGMQQREITCLGRNNPQEPDNY